jgi:serine/threonine protein kinase
VVPPNALKDIVLAQGTVNDRYGSVQLLSSAGNFSVVFRARCLTSGDLAALKFLAQTSDSRYRQECFEREGSLLWGPLRGEPRFVQLMEAPAVGKFVVTLSNGATVTLELPFLALEWMNAGDASSYSTAMPRTHRETLTRLECFREMVRAVHRLHNLNGYHRDLKPGNFLISNTSSGRVVKLGDFGTARIVDGSAPLLSAYHGPVGDRRYCAPELFSGVDVPPGWYRAADLFSIGAILFEFLTAQLFVSFTFKSIRDLVLFQQHLLAVPTENRLTVFNGVINTMKSSVPSVGVINPDLPRCAVPFLDDLVSEMTALDYRKRTITFDRVLRLVDIARLVVANETKYKERIARR